MDIFGVKNKWYSNWRVNALSNVLNIQRDNNSRYNDIKQCVFEQEEHGFIMNTYYVGIKGYQVPEILKRKPYTFECDIFSSGVVLFILLSGYPPFETASLKCMWYSPLINDINLFLGIF